MTTTAPELPDVGLDCPVWLPDNPAVPFHMRSCCVLDADHDGDHEPVDLEHVVIAGALVQHGILREMDEKDLKLAGIDYAASEPDPRRTFTSWLEIYRAGFTAGRASLAEELHNQQVAREAAEAAGEGQ